MRIRLAFSDDDSDDGMPLLVSALDEYTEDNWGRVPDWHTSAIEAQENVREAVIEISDDAVRALFALFRLSVKTIHPVIA